MRLQDSHDDSAILAELGQRLKRLRKRRKLSQSVLADQAFVSRSTLSKIENGHPVQTPEFIRVLQALGCLETLDQAIPVPQPSPVELLRARGGRQKRGPSVRSVADKGLVWPEDQDL